MSESLANPRRRRAGPLKVLDGIAVIGGVAVVACSVVGMLGDEPWWMDLFSHFRLQYLVLLMVTAVWLACARRWGGALLMLVGVGFNAALLSAFWWPPPAEIDPADPEMRLIFFNVLCTNDDYGSAVDWLADQRADVLVLCETHPAWEAQLRAGLPGYRVAPIDAVREGAFGAVVMIREGSEVRYDGAVIDPADRPMVQVDLTLAGRPMTLFNAHPFPPVHASGSTQRARTVELLQQRVIEADRPAIVAADLNATRWSAPLRRLLAATGLRDSAEGFGYHGTWPSGLWLTGMIPIDQVLVGPEFSVRNRWVGPDLGSDHRPVVVDLALRR